MATLLLAQTGVSDKGKPSLLISDWIQLTCQQVSDIAMYLASVDERVTVFWSWACQLMMPLARVVKNLVVNQHLIRLDAQSKSVKPEGFLPFFCHRQYCSVVCLQDIFHFVKMILARVCWELTHFMTAKVISGLVPSMRYNKDSMTCWNSCWHVGSTGTVFASGLYPVGRGVGVIFTFCMSNHVKICLRYINWLISTDCAVWLTHMPRNSLPPLVSWHSQCSRKACFFLFTRDLSYLREDPIINIDKGDDNLAILVFIDENPCIRASSMKTLCLHEWFKLMPPGKKCLFEAVQCAFQMHRFVLMSFYDKAFWLFHVDFFFEFPYRKAVFMSKPVHVHAF